MRTRFRVAAALAAAFTLTPTTAACTAGHSHIQGQHARPASKAQSLRGICPDTVVIQSGWFPQAEDGAFYRLLGGQELDVDTAHKTVTGALVDGGIDTGVKLQIRSGGPAVNNTPAAKLMYADPSITLAAVDEDQLIQFAVGPGDHTPVKAVFAPLDISPIVLMWSKDKHPTFHTPVDISRADTKVLYYPGSTYMSFLTGVGILRASQIDPSYQGAPDLFLASNEEDVQEGYLTNEVPEYEHELPQWHGPMGWYLVHNAGYRAYVNAMAVRAGEEKQLASCLKRLVPAMQRATVAYAEDPKATNNLIVKLVKQFNGYPYSAGRAAAAARSMITSGIIGNGPNHTIGDFDTARIGEFISILKPIYATSMHTTIPDSYTWRNVATNTYIDPTIQLQH